MRPVTSLRHEFVDFVPDNLQDGVIYLSMAHAITVHRCCCGCGHEVVAPLSPTDWKLIFDGETVTLDPSIGNWSFPCQSHYWIRRNTVEWAERWSRDQVDACRSYDAVRKARHFADQSPAETPSSPQATGPASPQKTSAWRRLLNWVLRQ